jgi:hypothetical protein
MKNLHGLQGRFGTRPSSTAERATGPMPRHGEAPGCCRSQHTGASRVSASSCDPGCRWDREQSTISRDRGEDSGC